MYPKPFSIYYQLVLGEINMVPKLELFLNILTLVWMITLINLIVDNYTPKLLSPHVAFKTASEREH